MHHAETFRAGSLPEVLVCFHVGVIVTVGDETEGYERYAFEEACLSQGAGLHVNGKGFREVFPDGLNLCLAFNETVSAGDEACQRAMCGCFGHQVLRRCKHCRKALNLAVGIAFAVPGVVISHGFTDYE